MSAARWDLSSHADARDKHLRRAKYGARMARETLGSTREVWRQHCRQHIKAARREHWLFVAHRRALSAGMFFRKTIGPEMRAH